MPGILWHILLPEDGPVQRPVQVTRTMHHNTIKVCSSYYIALHASIVHMCVSRVLAAAPARPDQSVLLFVALLQGLDILQTIFIFAVMGSMAFMGLQVGVRAS